MKCTWRELLLIAGVWFAAGWCAGVDQANAGVPADFHAVHFTGGKVLDIGDSHTWLAGGGEQYPTWDTDSQPGRDTTAGLDIYDASIAPRHVQVVFDLATNDEHSGATTQANLGHLWSRIGPDRTVLLVTTWATFGDLSEINQTIRDFASAHPARSAYVPWANYARTHPSCFAPDGVHFTSACYAIRTSMIADGARNLRNGT